MDDVKQSSVAPGGEEGKGDERPAFDLLASPLAIRIAPVLLLLSFVMPCQGLPFSICFFYNVTGLPCPACGLGRSFANLAHLRWHAAVRYHPFGPAIFLLVVALTALALAGERRREAVRRWVELRARAARFAYAGFVIAFLGFGLARITLAMMAGGDWFQGI